MSRWPAVPPRTVSMVPHSPADASASRSQSFPINGLPPITRRHQSDRSQPHIPIAIVAASFALNMGLEFTIQVPTPLSAHRLRRTQRQNHPHEISHHASQPERSKTKPAEALNHFLIVLRQLILLGPCPLHPLLPVLDRDNRFAELSPSAFEWLRAARKKKALGIGFPASDILLSSLLDLAVNVVL